MTNQDFEAFYEENNYNLELFDEAIKKLKSMKDGFDKQISEIYQSFRYIYPKLEMNLDLIFAKKYIIC